MKKYLLTILALGATMMMACNPDNNKGGGENPPVADYTLEGADLMGIFQNLGDEYEIGTNLCILAIGGFDDVNNPSVLKMFTLQYNVPIEENNGAGVLTPDNIDPETGAYTFSPNTYMGGFQDPEDPDYPFGTYYQEVDFNTEDILLTELVVGGNITVTYANGTHTAKGLLTLASGKVIKVDFSGTCMSPMIASLNNASANKFVNKFSSAAKFLKK